MDAPLAGKGFTVITLGCRTNHYESEAIASMLESRGAIYLEHGVKSPVVPDIVVVVTCSITSVADKKTEKLLRRLRRRSESSVIVACGCYAQGLSRERALALGVDILVGNRFKFRIADLLERWFRDGPSFREVRALPLRVASWDALSLDRPRIHTRAFVKVQDGCRRSCSYCIVPSVRGVPVSRDPQETVEEIGNIVSSGCREIVLTGIHLGSYRWGETSLDGLIAKVSSVRGLKRLRLGSLEPFAVTSGLLESLLSSPVFCPHLHLPLQSGDDFILEKMRRGYSASSFSSTIERVRRVLGDDVHLSTDLIVGFPGESDRAFENSLKLLCDLAFGRIHVFPFSPRRGTEAHDMPDRIPDRVIEERMNAAIALSETLLASYAAKWVGKCVSVLPEERSEEGVFSGWSRHYLKVFARNGSENACPVGDETTAYVARQRGGVLFGEDIPDGRFVPDEKDR